MSTVIEAFQKISRLINKGQERSVKAKKNILLSFFVKGASIASGFILLPLTIGYVNEDIYGIWLTISSVVTYFSFFDVGLGNGLRNKFAEAVAKGDQLLAKTYVSTTYVMLAVVSTAICLLFLLINPLLNWASIFKLDPALADQLSLVMLVVFCFFCLNFVLKLITTLLIADQRPGVSGIINLSTNVLSLLAIFILTQTVEGSLLNLAFVFSATPILTLSVASIIFFNGRYKPYAPSFKFVKTGYLKDLMSLGLKFFVIQLVGVIIFSTDNLIIVRVLGPAEVTDYNTAYKFFGIITQVYTIIATPFWSANTDAYHRGDISWIKKTTKKLVQVWGLMLVGAIILLLVSDFVYSIWVPTLDIPFWLSFWMMVYVLIFAWGTPFVNFSNGISKVRLQLYASIFGGIINIPLSVFLARDMDMGSAGVILATIISLGYGPFLAPIQYKKLISGKAKGIWNK